jgi:hypothetical protein
MNLTPQQIANQSANNLNSYILLTMAYLKEKGESPSDWLHYLGRKFIETWPSLKDSSLQELAEGIVLNNLSGGAKLVSLSGDDTKIEVILEQWPPQELLTFSGVSWEESQLIHEVLRPVFEQIGINYTWKLNAPSDPIVKSTYVIY